MIVFWKKRWNIVLWHMFIQRKKHQAKDVPPRSKYNGKCRRKGLHRLSDTIRNREEGWLWDKINTSINHRNYHDVSRDFQPEPPPPSICNKCIIISIYHVITCRQICSSFWPFYWSVLFLPVLLDLNIVSWI